MSCTKSLIPVMSFIALLFAGSGNVMADREGREFLDGLVEANAISSPVERMSVLEEVHSRLDSEYKEFIILRYLIRTAVSLNDMDKATFYAHKLLLLAEKFKDDWNYGNALHDANTALGWSSLQNGDVKLANRYLLKSCDISVSPQLKTFGPTMFLAKQLLEAGERDIVVNYLEKCKKIWSSQTGLIDSWVYTIKSGGKPDFHVYEKF